MKLFEWFFTHKKVDSTKEITPKEQDILQPNTTQVAEDLPIGFYQTTVGSYGYSITTQEEMIKTLIRRYRTMELVAEVDDGVDIVINEMIVPDITGNVTVDIDLKDCELSDSIKKKIEEAFNKMLKLLNFSEDSYDIVRRWYVDGRLHYNVVIEQDSPSKGIQSLVYLDANDIFLQKEVKNNEVNKFYYKFNNRLTNQNFEIHPDLVVYVGSGKFDRIDGTNPIEVSYLNQAVKPLNNLKNIEDSVVIYRLVRGPEKRVFKVNTGMLNKTAAEEYLAKIVQKFKNKLVYDTQTGEVNVHKNNYSMVEDFWFPINAQGKGTDVQNLEGGKGLTELDDLYYFRDIFYDSLKIPQSRRNNNRQERAIYNTSTEIELDEIVFYKMIQRLRKKFSKLFIELLRRELVWTKVMKKEEFDKIKNSIYFIYNSDNMYEETKQSLVFNTRINNVTLAEPYVGKYFTLDNIAFDILKFTEEEWKEKQADFEKNKEKYKAMSMMGNEEGGFEQPFSGNKFNSFKKRRDQQEQNPSLTDQDQVDKEEEKYPPKKEEEKTTK